MELPLVKILNNIEDVRSRLDLDVEKINMEISKNNSDYINPYNRESLLSLLSSLEHKASKDISNIYVYYEYLRIIVFVSSSDYLLLDCDKQVFYILSKYIPKDALYVSKIIIDKISLSEYLILQDQNIFKYLDIYVKCIKVSNFNNINLVPIEIEELDLINLRLTDNDTKSFERFPNLKMIDLSYNEFQNLVIKNKITCLKINNNPSLKSIDLNKDYLESIDISETRLTLNSLIGYRNLKEINYNNNYFKVPDVKYYFLKIHSITIKDLSIFQSFPLLTKLSIENVLIENNLFISEISKVLENLNIESNNDLDYQPTCYSEEHLGRLNVLKHYSRDFPYIKYPVKDAYFESDNIDIAKIIECDLIENLTLQNNEIVRIKNLNLLSGFRNLVSLKIIDPYFSMNHYFELDNLREVCLKTLKFYLSDNSFSKPEILTKMTIYGAVIGTSFKKYTMLKELSLLNVITYVSSDKLFPKLPLLEKINLSFEEKRNLDDRLLINLVNLKEASLGYIGNNIGFRNIFLHSYLLRKLKIINDTKVFAFKGLTNLDYLHWKIIEREDVKPFKIKEDALIELKNLCYLNLDLYNCNIEANIIKHMNNLKHLEFHNINNLSIEHISHLRTLECFDSSCCLFKSFEYARYFIEIILNNNKYLSKADIVYIKDLNHGHRYCNK